MTRRLDYYLTLASPWSFLGHAPLMELVSRHDVALSVKPALFGAIFDETGGLPYGKRHPARQKYRNVDLQRWRTRRGVALTLFPKFWPFDVAAADRLVVAAVGRGFDPDLLIRRFFAAVWQRDENLGDAGTRAAILDEIGLPANLVEEAASEKIGARYTANVADAVGQGVFGAPAYVLDGEVFWGQDRLDLLADALATGRAPFTGQD
jgi:2-hydroxychromene-2-carboxylate isomerase